MRQTHDRRRRRALIAAPAAGLALTALTGCGTSYPEANPLTTAARLERNTQTVYDALGLPGAALDAGWPSGGLVADGSDCYSKDLLDQVSDSPPTEPGVVKVSDTWALKGVTHPQAVAALARARRSLTLQGWEIGRYDESVRTLEMEATPPGAKDRMYVREYPEGRLEVAAVADCARFPEGLRRDVHDNPELPPQKAPAQLRHG